MRRTSIFGAALAIALAVGNLPAAALTGEERAAIRAEVEAVMRDYDERLGALENRLGAAEERAAKAEVRAAAAEARAAKAEAALAANGSSQTVAAAIPPPPTPPASGPAPRAPASANAFNPAIGVILNGSYTAMDSDPSVAVVPGFALGEEAGMMDRGFSLGESEVNFSANIDPFLYGNLVVSFSEEGAAVEEAYIQTIGIGGGFTLKGGRFFSGIGYLNEKHAHAWDFIDAPLPYRAMLGNQYGDDGVQLRWLAPADIFLEFGAEWFRGGSFPAAEATNEGKGTVTAFVHAGDDIDESSSWLAGASYIHTEASDRDTDGDIFSGAGDLGILSLVYKWAPSGNLVNQNLVLSGEYFFGNEDGTFNGVPVDYGRSGWYVQGVYQFMPHWRIGLRHDELDSDGAGPALAGGTLDPMGHSPQSMSAMIAYDTSEFGRFRLQYNYDESGLDPFNAIIFQYTVSYGAHGAHGY